ncbi:MAG: 30S ribosomal protein S21 [Phycisphaerales bacterium]
MAIRIKSRSGESTEQMLRRFKKLCEKEGLVKDIKRREFYEKPSERNRRDKRKSIARRVREAGGGFIGPREGGPGGGGGGRGERSFGGGRDGGSR